MVNIIKQAANSKEDLLSIGSFLTQARFFCVDERFWGKVKYNTLGLLSFNAPQEINGKLE